ncbi:hypothetical protein C8R43DRAFT_826181, partial [Mycena crocata]
NLLTMVLTPEEATQKLYGDVRCDDKHPVTVYIATSSKDAGKPYSRSGFGVYWGVNDGRNIGYRLDQGSESRAALVAVHHCVLAISLDRPLVIVTNSQYAIRTYCYWAGEYSTSGWTCTHGDVLQQATQVIRVRAAPISFQLNRPGPNAHAAAARDLARA